MDFDESSLQDNLFFVLNICFALFIPIYSFFFLRYNHNDIHGNQSFATRYGSLYANLDTMKDSVYKNTLYYCLRRLVVAAFTAFVETNIV